MAYNMIIPRAGKFDPVKAKERHPDEILEQASKGRNCDK